LWQCNASSWIYMTLDGCAVMEAWGCYDTGRLKFFPGIYNTTSITAKMFSGKNPCRSRDWW
jgi:hypothetical protein